MARNTPGILSPVEDALEERRRKRLGKPPAPAPQGILGIRQPVSRAQQMETALPMVPGAKQTLGSLPPVQKPQFMSSSTTNQMIDAAKQVPENMSPRSILDTWNRMGNKAAEVGLVGGAEIGHEAIRSGIANNVVPLLRSAAAPIVKMAFGETAGRKFEQGPRAIQSANQTVSSPSSTRPEVAPATPPPATVAANGVSKLETLANTVGGAKLMRPGQFFAKGAAGTMSGQVDTGLGIDHSKPTTSTGEELYRIGPGSDLSKVPVVGAQSFAANTPYKGRIIPQVQPMYRGDTSMSQSVASRQKATADRNQAVQEQIGLITAGQPLAIERAKSADAQAGRAFTGEQNRLGREADQKRAETTGEYGVKTAAARPIAEIPADLAAQLDSVESAIAGIKGEPEGPERDAKLAEANKSRAAIMNQMAGGAVPATPGSTVATAKEGQKVKGPDGKIYVIKNGKPVLA